MIAALDHALDMLKTGNMDAGITESYIRQLKTLKDRGWTKLEDYSNFPNTKQLYETLSHVPFEIPENLKPIISFGIMSNLHPLC